MTTIFEYGIVRDGFDAFLLRQDFIVAGHYRDRAEFKTFGEMHRTDCDHSWRRFALAG